MKKMVIMTFASLLIATVAPTGGADSNQYTVSGTLIQDVQWWGVHHHFAHNHVDVAQIEYEFLVERTPAGIEILYADITVTSAGGEATCRGIGDDVEGEFNDLHVAGVVPGIDRYPCFRLGPQLDEVLYGYCELNGFMTGFDPEDGEFQLNEIHLSRESALPQSAIAC